MKSPISLETNVSITLIIVGLVLLISPYVHSLIMAQHISDLLQNTTHRSVNLNASLPDWYDGAAFFIGSLLCLTGIAGGIKPKAEQ